MKTFAFWFTALRIPFASVALVPFAVGFIWAFSEKMEVSWLMFILGEIAVLLICFSCHLFGEIFDQVEDKKTLVYGRSKFAGGTLMIATGKIPPIHAAIAAAIFLFISFVCGLIITFYYKNFILFGLGFFGAACAVLYSVPPLRLVRRGLGELFIGICYGWLTLVTGYATASGCLPSSNSILFCLPVALSVFNIILINEYPDFQADFEVGKKNLMIRLGKKKASMVYAVANILIIFSFLIIYINLYQDSLIYILILIPVSVVALVLSYNIAILRKYEFPAKLEKCCASTILLNHICSITLAVLFICR